jgi:GNAT superfamily N-acetyltransferase
MVEDGSRSAALPDGHGRENDVESIGSSSATPLRWIQTAPGHVPLTSPAQDQSLAAPHAHATADASLTAAVHMHSEVAAVTIDLTGKPAEPTGPRPALRAVRITRREDVVRAIGIAREAHRESRYGHLPFSEAKFLRVYGRMLARPGTSLGVFVERGGEVVGAMGASIGEHYLATGGRIATTHFLYVSGALRDTALGGRVAAKLMRLFIDWAKSNGADEINVHATSGIDPERTDKFLKRLGLQPYGGNYAARLGN